MQLQLQSLVRAENFTGAAMIIFAFTTTLISPYHNYLGYILTATGGTATLLLAHITERRDCRCN